LRLSTIAWADTKRILKMIRRNGCPRRSFGSWGMLGHALFPNRQGGNLPTTLHPKGINRKPSQDNA